MITYKTKKTTTTVRLPDEESLLNYARNIQKKMMKTL